MNDPRLGGYSSSPTQSPTQTGNSAPRPVQPIDASLDPIELVMEELEEISPDSAAMPSGAPSGMPTPMQPGGIPSPAMPKSKIKAFGVEAARPARQWKRTPTCDGQGAVRVKSFHGKYSDQGVEHLDDIVNEWLDNHPGVEVKFVTSTVHVFEGKIREPALVLNLWY